MKIYLAGPEPFGLKLTKGILLSYYDIALSLLPFRKKTWKIITDKK
jgi:hypothetical protein